jgi:DNA-binding response OmpR family regulator
MKALVVDDDRVLADVVAFTLRREGFEVIQAFDGVSALRRWSDENPDIILLDVNMPKMDGFTVCRRIREQADTPIILLTVREEEDDVVQGLDIGADDYIVKPFSPRQLVARAKAILRRAGQVSPSPELRVSDLTFDPNRRAAIVGHGDPIALTRLENLLLECLMVNAGQVMTIEAIIDHVWGPEGADRDMLRQLVRRLRGKIELDPSNPTYIRTIPGLGYGMVSDRDMK